MTLVEELRSKKSRDNRGLLDRAADRIEELEAGYRKEQQMTNFERIKAMSVEMLADFICDIYASNEHREIRVNGKWMHPEDVEEWLERKVEGEW